MKTCWWVGLVLVVAACAGDDGVADAGSGSDSGASSTGGDGGSDTTLDTGGSDQGDTGGTASGSESGPATGSDGSTSMATTSDSGSDSDSDSGTDSGTDGSGSSGSTGAAVCGPEIGDLQSAVAILVGEYPDPPDSGGGSGGSGSSAGSTTTGGDGPDPDTLRIRLSNYVTLTCEDPYGSFECQNGVDVWRVTINVPPEMVAPGTYDLADMQVGYSVVGMCGGGGGDGGGGGGFDGTLVIDSIGPAGISGCVQDADLFDVDINGSFTAENCSKL